MAKYLNLAGLQTLWTKAKNTFAPKTHTHKDNIDEISATATGAVTDNMDIVTSNGNRTVDVKVYRRSVTLLWDYIVSKCKSTFSATDTNPITGKGVYEFNKMNWASFSTNVRNSGLYGNTSILCSKLLNRYVYDIYCNDDITLTIINDTTATKNLTVNGDQNAYVSLETNAETNISLTKGSWIHFVMIDNSLFLSVRKQAKSIYLSQFLQGKSALCIHPESVQVLIPYAFNDQYRNIDNGGTSILYETDSTDFTQVELNKTKTISENTKAFFDGSSEAASWTSTSGDSVTVVDVKGYSDMAWTTRLYIDFGSAWGFANVKCYVMKSSSAYVEAERDQYGNGFWTFRTAYNGTSYQKRFRFVMWNTSATANTSHRIAQIGTVRYNSPLFLTTLASKYHTHTGAQITSAVNYSKMQEAELLTSSDDLLEKVRGLNSGQVKWYRWEYGAVPANSPTSANRCLCQAIPQYGPTGATVRITLLAYPQDSNNLYYSAHYARNNGTDSAFSWNTVYYKATSTYSATGTQAVNGTAVASAINGKANAASVTGATKCKVTYNSQGVITAGADLAASDIPNLATSKITSGTFADERIASASKWNAKQDDISNIIPTAASASNPLCDKAYADAIGERLEARYLGCNANGDPFATHATLTSATKFYYQGAETNPDTNDITTVVADEDHKNTSNVAGTTRYRYGGVDASGKPVWAFEYVINNTGLSQAQLLAVNSGITTTKVGNYDTHIADTTKHITATERTAWNGKQNALTQGTNITISGNTISATDTTYSEASKTDVEKIVTDLS